MKSPSATSAAATESVPRAVAAPLPRERLRDLLRWHRIPGGLRYLRRFGVIGLLRRLFPSLRTYRAWIDNYDTLSGPDIEAIRQHIAALACRPLVSLLLPVGDADTGRMRRAITLLGAQLYPDWELCVGSAPTAARTAASIVAALGNAAGARIKLATAGPEGGLADQVNAALAIAAGALVAVVRVEDELALHALYVLALEAGQHPEAMLLYSDEDALGSGGERRGPRFKPDWDPDLLLGDDFVGRLAAYRRGIVVALGGFRAGFDGAEEHDLALRAAERIEPQHIRHIPMILYHRREAPTWAEIDPAAAGATARCRAVGEHLDRMRVAATASPLPGDRVRVRYALSNPAPGVSLIVPTRDNRDTLERCVDGLLERTDYEPLELVIVDNDSRRAETLAYFSAVAERPGVRVLRFAGPFNYSAVNNFAVAQARYGIVGLVNDDVDVIHPDWLREMVSHAVRPEVGAVGAKLYYPNDTIQHAGTIVGLGGAAGHAFRHFPRGDAGYCGRLLLTQSLSAVTAACMILRREVFDEVGGLDEVNLAIAFNDVDLCLRIRERGYRIVWTPFAALYHWESVSRGSDLAPERIERFRREAKYLGDRWRAVIARDPYYNPNLTADTEDFGLAFPPRLTPPWSAPVDG